MFADIDNPGSASTRGNDPAENKPDGTDLELDLDEGTGQEEPTSTGEETRFFEGEIPIELQPVYKKMQAGLTKKFQEVAEMRKSLQSPELQQKAILFDKIFSTQEGQQMLATLMAGGSLEDADGLVDDDSESGELQQTGADDRLGKRVKQIEENLKRQMVEAERRDFELAYPNWEQEVGKVGMQNAWRENPSLTMKQAYELAAYRKAVARRDAKRKQATAVVEKPGTSHKGVRGDPNRIPSSVQEAAQMAMEQLEHGDAIR